MLRPQSFHKAPCRIWLTVRWTAEQQERSYLSRSWQAFHLGHLPGDPEARARQLVAALDGAIRSAALRRQAPGAPREQIFSWEAGAGYVAMSPAPATLASSPLAEGPS